MTGASVGRTSYSYKAEEKEKWTGRGGEEFNEIGRIIPAVGDPGRCTSSSAKGETKLKCWCFVLYYIFHLFDRGPSQHQPTAGLLPLLLLRSGLGMWLVSLLSPSRPADTLVSANHSHLDTTWLYPFP